MWFIINLLQGIIISLWTVVCATLAMLTVLLTGNSRWAIFVGGRLLWSRVLLMVCGIRLHVHGKEHVDRKGNYIYVSNHESLLDIPAIVTALPVPLFFIAKKELKKVPFMGWAMQVVGMIFIDRGNRESAQRSMKEAGEKIRRGKNVISFPEGTRTKTGEVGIFRRGTFILAKEEKISLVPVGISGARKCLPQGSFRPRPGSITIRIGQPIESSSFATKSVEEIAEKSREAVLKLIEQDK